ncbi:type-2 restriction enzyme PvuII [Candidatus Termititenax aidoneus]|uniref:Type-2 restriction enzyme PvuII n=1 Tax=Termititenax aidoneus TaxID=2218524 RepID=A0A388T7M6_TERA1|nr:type-2 restriction enzyme PvuII [Candidatus Termititenax aidoneus]
MTFYDNKHKEIIKKLEQLWGNLDNLSDLAKQYGIEDIFQDNGAKVLQQLIYLDMSLLPGREGNDCISKSGAEWEMKSVNLDTSASGFSTNHHTNHDIIAKYRKVPWAFAIYHGIKLSEIYVMTAKMLEPIYQHWEEKLKTMAHLNNPKIPIKFVQENGIKVFPIDSSNPIDPDSINK